MLIHKESKSLLLKLKPETLAKVQTLLPTLHKRIDYQQHNIAVPHTVDITRVLRNLGINAPSPIRYHYHWPRPARFASVFEHQYATAEFLTLHQRCFVLNEMGTSKTASACWAADYLMSVGKVKRVLIVSPLSTLTFVWLNELFDVCMHRTALVLHADAEKRRDLLAREVDFYIINHDGLKIIQKDLAKRKDIDLIIVDEAADYRNGRTDRYKVLEEVARERKLWLMTGAPTPNAPTDAWALARLVDKTKVPKYFSVFQQETMVKITQYKWVPRQGSHEIAYRALQPAIRFRKADCLSLPPVTFSNREVGLSAEQEKAYGEMKTHMVTTTALSTLSAANAADRASKLRQILCGAVKTGEDTYEMYDHGPRLKVLLETIEQASAKVLVIVPFKGITRVLTDEINDWHARRKDGKTCMMVNGDVTPRERDAIFTAFRDDPNLNELVCHPKVMSHGLTLVQADMLVFYAPIYSSDQTGQVMDRINRPGQTRNMTIVRLIANAFEKGIYAMVEQRRESQESMLALYKQELGVQ